MIEMKMSALLLFLTISINPCLAQEYSWKISSFWWTDNDCYDCNDCGGALLSSPTKGSLLKESKSIWGYCEGKDIGKWEVNYIEKCIDTWNEEKFLTITNNDKRFDNIDQIKIYIDEVVKRLCENGSIQEGYESKEMKRKRLDDKEIAELKEEEDIWKKYEAGEITPQVSISEYTIPKNTLKSEFIFQNDWVLSPDLATKINLRFNTDGTFVMERRELWEPLDTKVGKYRFTDDNFVELTYEPQITRSWGRTFFSIKVDKLSWTEMVGSYYVGDSRKGKGYSAYPILTRAAKKEVKNLDGKWSLRIRSDKRNIFYDYVLNVQSDSNQVSGQILESYFDGEKFCSKGNITGFIKNDSLELKMDYDNSNCSGNSYLLKCRFIFDDLLFGKTEFYVEGGRGNSIFRKTKMDFQKLSLKRIGNSSKSNIEQDNLSEGSTRNKKKEITDTREGSNLDKEPKISIFNDLLNLESWNSFNSESKKTKAGTKFRPLIKKEELIIISPTVLTSSNARNAYINIDKSKVKSGVIKIYVSVLEISGEYLDKLIHEDIQKFELDKDARLSTLMSGKQFDKIRISLSRYRGKKIRVKITYQSTGVGKPFIEIGDIDIK